MKFLSRCLFLNSSSLISGLVSDHSGMSATTCGAMLVLAIPVMCIYQVMAGAWCLMNQVSPSEIVRK